MLGRVSKEERWYESFTGRTPLLLTYLLSYSCRTTNTERIWKNVTSTPVYRPFSRTNRASRYQNLLELRMMQMVVITGAIRRAKLQSNRHHHQQTNTQLFTGRMSFLSPNQQCRSTEGKPKSLEIAGLKRFYSYKCRMSFVMIHEQWGQRWRYNVVDSNNSGWSLSSRELGLRVGGRLTLFYIHQMNRKKSCNDLVVMMTALYRPRYYYYYYYYY